MRSIGRIAALAALALAAGACVPRNEPAPTPPPRQAPPPTPLPSPPPPPAPGWEDAPLTPGAWHYGSEPSGSQAAFGPPRSEPLFLLRCDRASRRVTLSREGAAASFTVRTSTAARSLPATSRSAPLASLSASVAASDPLLDAIAFSRGRFAVDAPGLARLVLPAWPETARVAEDCRG